MRSNDFPPGLDEQGVRDLIEYYESQTDEEAAAEHEAALASPTGTLMEVPTELVPLVRDLIARHLKKRQSREKSWAPGS
ncbi:MAG TPA: hypothetical protein VEL74_14310 [Thermoanaerobaculia bacterium]|nr:hypothetical protein [Thermoanaerobaculia bacterium]